MNRKKVENLRAQLKAMRSGTTTGGREIRAFAKAVGRVEKKKRTGDPAWVSTKFSDLRPVRIPGHTAIKKFTARGILNSLEEDLDQWDALLDDSTAEGDDE